VIGDGKLGTGAAVLSCAGAESEVDELSTGCVISGKKAVCAIPVVGIELTIPQASAIPNAEVMRFIVDFLMIKNCRSVPGLSGTCLSGIRDYQVLEY
jgi:hypothetical protein